MDVTGQIGELEARARQVHIPAGSLQDHMPRCALSLSVSLAAPRSACLLGWLGHTHACIWLLLLLE